MYRDQCPIYKNFVNKTEKNVCVCVGKSPLAHKKKVTKHKKKTTYYIK